MTLLATSDAPVAAPDHAPVAGQLDSGATVVLLVVGGSAAAAFVLPGLVDLALPVISLAVGLQLLSRGRVVAFWELVVWLYLVAPGIRRIVDWHAGYHANSPVLVAAPLVSLLGLLALTRTRALRRMPALAFSLMLLSTGYAALLGLLLASPTAVLVGLLEWASPLGVGALLLFATYDRAAMRAALLRTTRWGLLVLGGYGMVQFFFLPPWDAAWMISVRDVLSSIGLPKPLEVRVFSTGNSPGPLGAVLALLVLTGLCTRRRLIDDVALAVGLASLGLCLVRASWLECAVGLLLLVLSGRVPVLRVVGGVLVALVLLLSVGGPLADAVLGRVDTTTSAGSRDESLQARLTFQTKVLPEVLRRPVGQGLGSTGVAAQRDDSATAIANVDSGYVELLLVLGAPLGLLSMGALIAAGVSCWRDSLAIRGPDAPLQVALASTAVVLPLSLVFDPSVTAASGVFFWTIIAYAGDPRRAGRAAVTA